MPTEQVPSNGRVVHYSMGGDWHQAQHQTALVVHVLPEDRINVVAFDRHGNDERQQMVDYDPTGNRPHSWHWPEYVPARATPAEAAELEALGHDLGGEA